MQKRIVLLITVLSLMLCGCAGKAPDSSASGLRVHKSCRLRVQKPDSQKNIP